jgi:hypothetical protein
MAVLEASVAAARAEAERSATGAHDAAVEPGAATPVSVTSMRKDRTAKGDTTSSVTPAKAASGSTVRRRKTA